GGVMRRRGGRLGGGEGAGGPGPPRRGYRPAAPGQSPTRHASPEDTDPVNSLVQPDQRDRPEETTWNAPEMRAALAARDITRIYRLLQKVGFSQQKIAPLPGQSPPGVSEILR